MENQIEQLLREGKRDEAYLIIDIKKLPLHKSAEFLRRSGRAFEAIKLLFVYVKNLKRADPVNVLEYVFSLIFIGSLYEAEMLLSTIVLKRAFFARALLEMARWDYLKAQKFLLEYLKEDLSDYELQVALTNKFACDIELNQLIINEIDHQIEYAKKVKYLVLQANLLELKSQWLIRKKINNPDLLLKEASALINDSYDKLFILKWKWISEISISSRLKLKKDFEELKKLSKELNESETLRELDFYGSQIWPELAVKVYFGTPYSAYRDRISLPKNSNKYLYALSQNKNSLLFDFESRDMPPMIKKVLRAFLIDFYRNKDRFFLWEYIFSGERLSPHSSFNKIHQALNRTRNWLKVNNIPLAINESNGNYYLEGPVTFLLHHQGRWDSFEVAEIKKILFPYRGKVFGVHELPFKVRTAQRLILKAITLKLLEKMGKKTNITYRVLF